MCYIKMFYLQMKQVKKEIIRNSRSMTMPNLYVDHEKSKLKICSLINKNVLCRLPRTRSKHPAMRKMHDLLCILCTQQTRCTLNRICTFLYSKRKYCFYIHISASTVGIFYNKLKHCLTVYLWRSM